MTKIDYGVALANAKQLLNNRETIIKQQSNKIDKLEQEIENLKRANEILIKASQAAA